MKRIFKFLLITIALVLIVVQLVPQKRLKTALSSTIHIPTNLQEGDIFFQYNHSPTCDAIRIATQSKFSHCGILLQKNNTWYIFEAIGPVKYTALKDWIGQGDDNYFEQLRLRTPEKLDVEKVHTYASVLNNKPYDSYYLWDNANIYCSELVWKLYKYAAIELCKPKQLKEYYLNDDNVKKQLEARFGNSVPLEETIVSPEDLFRSSVLTRVK